MLLDRLRVALDPLPAPGAGVPPEISAAVLLLLDPTDPGLPLLFIRRTRQVSTHRGQVAFPGGGVEPGDASVVDAALREAREEMAIPPESVEPLGLLTMVWTRGSERSLLPVVGRQRSDVVPVAEPDIERNHAPVRKALVRLREIGGRVEDDRRVLRCQRHAAAAR